MSIQLFDGKGETVLEATISAEELKRAFANVTEAKEYRMRISESGLSVDWVDAANVSAGEFNIPADVFEHYEIEWPHTTGISHSTLMRRLNDARMGDTIRLNVGESEVTSTIKREYEYNSVEFHSTFKTIDPDSIRDYDSSTLPDWSEQPNATVDRKAFADAVDAIGADHVHFESEDGDLLVRGKGDNEEDAVVIEDSGPDGMNSIYSGDYIEGYAKALSTVKVDTITLFVGEEWPMVIEYERDSGVSGNWFQAPRIHNNGDN